MPENSILRVQSTPVDDALALAAMGVPIIPLKPHSKEPRIQNWPERASTDPATIRQWWSTWPDSNIGTVIPPGRLTVDVDPRNGGAVGLKNLLARHGDLPATWRVWSGREDGGSHLHYAVPETIKIPYLTDIDMGVQILGLRHLVLLPPSLHPDTGKAYAWDDACNPETMRHPAWAPGWLLDLVVETAKRHRTTQGNPSKTKPSGVRFARESNKVPEILPPPLSTLFEGEGPGRKLVSMACDPRNLSAMLQACGLPSTLQVGHSTRCPFHDDQHPSASLLGPTEEHPSYGLYCHAATCPQKEEGSGYASLTDIFHYRESANLLKLHTETDSKGHRRDHAALRLQWTTRLLATAGVIHLHELGCPSLPSNAPADAQAVWNTYLDVRRVRAATRKKDDPFPFSLRFIQDWLGRVGAWTSHRINKAKRWLIARGFLVPDGNDTVGERLWRIGRNALRRARTAAPMFSTEREAVADVAATPVPDPVQVERPSACPLADVRASHFTKTHCEHCCQAYLEALRAQKGTQTTPLDPYGLERLGVG